MQEKLLKVGCISLLFYAGIFFAPVFCSDLLNDSIPDSHAEFQKCEPSPAEQHTADLLLQFAKTFSLHIADGRISREGMEQFFTLLEKDPGSHTLLTYFYQSVRNNPQVRRNAVAKLQSLAEKHPEEWVLQQAVAEILTADKEYDAAKVLWGRAFRYGVMEPQEDRENRQRIRASLITQYLMFHLLFVKEPEKSLEGIAFLQKDVRYNTDPDVKIDIIGVLALCAENAGVAPLLPLGAVAGDAWRAEKDLHKACEEFLSLPVKPFRSDRKKRALLLDIFKKWGHLSELEKMLERHGKKYPDDVELLLMRGRAAFLRKDYAALASLTYLALSKGLSLGDPVVFDLVLVQAYHLKDPAGAIKLLDRMRYKVALSRLLPLYIGISRDSRNYEAAFAYARMISNEFQRDYQISRLYVHQGDLAAAYRAAQSALRTQRAKKLRLPDNDFFYYCVELAERQKDIAGVKDIMEPLIQEDPENPELKNNLGYILADHNMELENAYKLISGALQKKPENHAYLDSMAWVLYRMKRYKEAAEYIERSLKYGRDSVILDHAGDIFHALGDRDKAEKYWKLALQQPGGEKELLLSIEKKLRSGGADNGSR